MRNASRTAFALLIGSKAARFAPEVAASDALSWGKSASSGSSPFARRALIQASISARNRAPLGKNRAVKLLPFFVLILAQAGPRQGFGAKPGQEREGEHRPRAHRHQIP